MADDELTPDLVAAMDNEQRLFAGAELDGIHIEERKPPTGGRWSERLVVAAFVLAGLGFAAAVACFIVVPWKFRLGDNGSYKWFAPALGMSFALGFLGLGVGAILWGKKLMPEEEVVQERHDEPSGPVDRLTTAGALATATTDTGLPRRRMLRRAVAFAGGLAGVAAIVPAIGTLVRRPGTTLMHTQWRAGARLIDSEGRPLRPEDLNVGALVTVFPDVPGGIDSADTPTILIRLPPGVSVHPRPGQGGWGWGSFVAFSKVCTHLGCPVGLYEQRTHKLLCPCHQSQFDVLADARPTFGPAARPLPQLPITVDNDGYFVARSGYREPVGPSYWERPNP